MIAALSQYILVILTFFPVLGALLLFFIPKENLSLQRHFSLAIAIIEFVFSLHLIRYFIPGELSFQFVQNFAWLPLSTGIRFIVGVDGLNLLLVILTTTLTPLIILSTYSSVTKHTREFLALFLILESAMLGTFFSLDIVLFYVFWEAMLIPMYFLIGVWGGENRVYATIKFFLYTAAGSLLMLVALGYLYYTHAHMHGGQFSGNLLDLYKTASALPISIQIWLFSAITLAFAIKIPVFPFHTWLPDAHVEAPTAGSVVLAGVLLKMGTFGLMRFSLPLFPQVAQIAAPFMIIIGIIGIIYGALVAWRQTDIKKLIAYSSVSHLGFVVVGIFSLNEQGLTGALYQMVNHGVSTGALFLLVGVIYERRHTRAISEFGGLAKVMPLYTLFFVIATLGSVALPGTGGFIGEWLILWGVFKVNPLFGALAATGVVLGAIYMLSMVLRMFWGPLDNEKNKNLTDLSFREAFILGLLSIFIFAMGIFPAYILDHAQANLLQLKQTVTQATPYIRSLGDAHE